MNYSTTVEISGSPSLTLDSMDKESCKTMANFTGIDLSKLVYFIRNFGLRRVLEQPSLMGITKEQETLLKNIRILLLFGGDEAHGTNVTAQPVRS